MLTSGSAPTAMPYFQRQTLTYDRLANRSSRSLSTGVKNLLEAWPPRFHAHDTVIPDCYGDINPASSLMTDLKIEHID